MFDNENENGENVAQPQAQAQSLDTGIGGLQSFNPRRDSHNVSQRWKKWLRGFRLYVMGKGVTHNAQKQGGFFVTHSWPGGVGYLLHAGWG